jgi:hypothetical protein
MERRDATKTANRNLDGVECVAVLGEDDDRLLHAADDAAQHVHLPVGVLHTLRSVEKAL